MNDKVEVPDEAINLWIKFLTDSIWVLNADLIEPSGSLKKLFDLGLIEVKEKGRYHSKVSLREEDMMLTSLQKRALTALALGLSREDYVKWARSERIESPLEFLKELTDLDIVRSVGEIGKIRFVSR